jgi:hypothetical protein
MSSKSGIKIVSKQDLQTIQKIKEIQSKTQKINENREIKEQNKPKKQTFTAKNFLKTTSRNYTEKPKIITKSEPIEDYNEYKEGIKGVFYDCLCMIERNSDKKGRLKDKLIESKDIKRIVSKKLGYFNYFENETVILFLTVFSKWLEVKTGTGTLTPSAVTNE